MGSIVGLTALPTVLSILGLYEGLKAGSSVDIICLVIDFRSLLQLQW